MLHDGVFKDLPEARTCVGKSFDVKIYEKNVGSKNDYGYNKYFHENGGRKDDKI